MQSATDIEAVASGEFHRDRWSKAFLILGLGSLALAIMMIVVVVATRHDGAAWDPLGSYPQQTVDGGPFRVGETVPVTARKCADEDGVHVRGTSYWQAVDVPGVIVQTANGAERQRFRSCGPTPDTTAFVFRNDIPPAVVALVEAQGPSRWRITGTETPFDHDGREGVPRTWVTDTFVVLP